MKRWEYKILGISDHCQDIFLTPSSCEETKNYAATRLDELGRDGWELVSVVETELVGNYRFFFKRPME